MGQRPDRDREDLFIISRAKCEIPPNSKIYAQLLLANLTQAQLPPLLIQRVCNGSIIQSCFSTLRIDP